MQFFLCRNISRHIHIGHEWFFVPKFLSQTNPLGTTNQLILFFNSQFFFQCEFEDDVNSHWHEWMPTDMILMRGSTFTFLKDDVFVSYAGWQQISFSASSLLWLVILHSFLQIICQKLVWLGTHGLRQCEFVADQKSRQRILVFRPPNFLWVTLPSSLMSLSFSSLLSSSQKQSTTLMNRSMARLVSLTLISALIDFGNVGFSVCFLKKSAIRQLETKEKHTNSCPGLAHGLQLHSDAPAPVCM